MTTTITSTSNQRIKDTIRLRDRRGRQRQGRILIEGTREIGQALQAGVSFHEVFICRPHCDLAAEELQQHLAAAQAARFEVSADVWEKLAFGERHEGIICTADPPFSSLEELDCGLNPLIVVLEQVQKPGNVGAVCRSADAVGADALIVADAGTDLFNPNAIRASLGTLFRVPMVASPSATTRSWLVEKRIAIYAARVGDGPVYTEVDWTQPSAIVLGSENQGLSATWCGDEISAVHLPMLGTADSLNVSNTAAIVLYEALRQRRLSDDHPID